MTPAFAQRKAALRSASIARRDAIDASVRTAFAAKLARGLTGPLRRFAGQGVALYVPVRNEPDCFPLLHALHAEGCRTLLPAVVGGIATELDFRAYSPGGLLTKGPVGDIPEPPASHGSTRPAVVFVPGAAFDRTGGRIGFGRGYYDATLRALRSQAPILAIGLAFACQEVEHVPLEPHDERLDVILTERDVVVCSQTGKSLDAPPLHW